MSKNDILQGIIMTGIVAGAFMGILLIYMSATHLLSGMCVVLGVLELVGAVMLLPFAMQIEERIREGAH